MFTDYVRILAKAGKGGNGCVSFCREAFRPHGGPDGGDGGKGGDVILKVNPQVTDLTPFFFSPHQFAEDGQAGKGKKRKGRDGKNLELEIPPGVVVYRLPAAQLLHSSTDLLPIPKPGEPMDKMVELLEPGMRFILCKGGRGGRGNFQFRSPINQAPRYAEEGEEGESGQFLLELKTIADVGFLGMPNAGKSTLLSKISSAKPKIAPYPFTTIRPHVGIVSYEDGLRISFADIPGLIQGAHLGKGLGFYFLRHVERSRILVYVLDLADPMIDPISVFYMLQEEIEKYNKKLLEKPFIVVGNKIDLLPIGTAKQLAYEFEQKTGYPLLLLSAREGSGIHQFLEQCREMVLVVRTSFPSSKIELSNLQ
ncbi:GTPase [Methylacidiphilum kamchatkense Kam1]|uniref:GTPase Obg n=1 Tax=Methylacidiphilum kamchatkense Kam1 TaxID=1202785 RepID=A0A0C1UMH3_9BACT|nr:GTPase ObgE [Methylacidiphilum kamchatkense]KIE57769.1 GTPase [Methylacidiphilum kamchatkense Kam1]QDQ42485.1 GTP-binding protein [Methylacidiphilum kamchatkense Kam1]